MVKCDNCGKKIGFFGYRAYDIKGKLLCERCWKQLTDEEKNLMFNIKTKGAYEKNKDKLLKGANSLKLNLKRKDPNYVSEKKLVATWLKNLSYILVGFFVIRDYINNLAEYAPVTEFERYEAIGAASVTLIFWLIFIACGNKCSKLASEIKKNPNVAYVIGFMFSLLGLLGYGIYYENVKTKKLKITNPKK